MVSQLRHNKNDEPLTDREFITSAKLAKTLGVAVSTIYSVMDAGQLPYYRIGKTRRIAIEDARAYIDSRRIGKPVLSRHLKAL